MLPFPDVVILSTQTTILIHNFLMCEYIEFADNMIARLCIVVHWRWPPFYVTKWGHVWTITINGEADLPFHGWRYTDFWLYFAGEVFVRQCFSSVFVNPQNMLTALLLFDFKAYKFSLDSYRKWTCKSIVMKVET